MSGMHGKDRNRERRSNSRIVSKSRNHLLDDDVNEPSTDSDQRYLDPSSDRSTRFKNGVFDVENIEFDATERREFLTRVEASKFDANLASRLLFGLPTCCSQNISVGLNGRSA